MAIGIALVVLLLGVVLGAVTWPSVRRFVTSQLRNRTQSAPPSPGGTGAWRLIPGPELSEEAAPLLWGDQDDGEREAVRALLARIEAGLERDDPRVWPEPARAAACLREAHERMDVAELIAELESPTLPGGRQAHGELVAAADLLIEARLRHAVTEEIHAALARLLLIRSRARRFQHWREGLVAAARFANEAIVSRPGHVPSRVLLAGVQVGLGRLDAARHGLVTLMSESPDDVEVLRVRSRWLRAHGDVVAAADAAQRIIPRLEEGKARIERLRAGRMLIEIHRAKEAEPLLRSLVAEFPERGELWFLLGRALLDGGRVAEATDAARKAVELHPTKEARELYGQAIGKAGS